MKKNIIAAMLSSLLIFTAILSASAEKKFSGRVIFVAGDYIELKKGKNEILLYLTEKSKFISRKGIESKAEILKICQYADAYYSIDGSKKVLNKLVITKESDCFK